MDYQSCSLASLKSGESKAEKAVDAKEQIKVQEMNKASDVKDEVKDKAGKVEETIGNIKESVKEKVDQIRGKAGDNKDKMQDAVSEQAAEKAINNAYGKSIFHT